MPSFWKVMVRRRRKDILLLPEEAGRHGESREKKRGRRRRKAEPFMPVRYGASTCHAMVCVCSRQVGKFSKGSVQRTRPLPSELRQEHGGEGETPKTTLHHPTPN